ncbi:response regulator transcription factor [Nocardioides panacisoli]|uniref:Response regulator transcription factor n=1 Tax=Nocardioides panacisoli TaxID=627624 RepID=A0ABP7IHT4_9ACTN
MARQPWVAGGAMSTPSTAAASSTTVDRRIAVVDDHQLLAESLGMALSVHGYDVRRIPVPATGGAPGALVAAVQRIRPRVVLLDLDLGGFGDGGRLLGPLSRSGIRVVVLTGSIDPPRWGAALASGASTVVAKSRALNEVISIVRRANEGLSVMDGRERDDLIAAWHDRLARQDADEDRLARLTPRESEVLAALMDGRSVRDIAAASVVSTATVRTQVKSILAKLDVSSQLAAVSLAHRCHWRYPGAA